MTLFHRDREHHSIELDRQSYSSTCDRRPFFEPITCGFQIATLLLKHMSYEDVKNSAHIDIQGCFRKLIQVSKLDACWSVYAKSRALHPSESLRPCAVKKKKKKEKKERKIVDDRSPCRSTCKNKHSAKKKCASWLSSCFSIASCSSFFILLRQILGLGHQIQKRLFSQCSVYQLICCYYVT
ncbi:hypothetical protein B9Z55_028959 [Caenorhabditis nigoni]|uniref:Uncharacterized protein n=1 Tax=Caenorhabditis nigoni TaxID=1611254 RepID=A0A2G5S9N7_9PELO|nr:hypothetical protein B9Z55_028959 [Caenorhabditis nigoni]